MLNKEYAFFGDIAGRYEELIILVKQLKKLHPNAIPVSLGDLHDRGPKSKECIEYFINNGICIDSNHGHLMVDFFRSTKFYDDGIWLGNGGVQTLESYMDLNKVFGDSGEMIFLNSVRDYSWSGFNGFSQIKRNKLVSSIVETSLKHIPESHIRWLEDRPRYFKADGLIATHAAINPVLSFERCLAIGENAWGKEINNSVLWNRGKPRKMEGTFQIHGHIAHRQVKHYGYDDNRWGIDLDTTRGYKLTCMHWPSKELYEQEYL